MYKDRTKVKILILSIVVLIIITGIVLTFKHRINRQSNVDITQITDLRVNYMNNPIAIENIPVFSWRMESDIQGQCQAAYEILVADNAENLKDKRYIWDSGKIDSDISVGIEYEGPELENGKQYFWKVNVWDKDNKVINSNTDNSFTTGLSQSEWDNAKWIYLPREQTIEEQNQNNSYTISYKTSLDESYSGFVWGADSNCYGEYYVWAFDTRGDIVELVTSRYVYEDQFDEIRYPLESAGFNKEDFINKEHSVCINVENTHVTTYLDEEQIAETDVYRSKAVGQIGFWTDRGAFYGIYDDIDIRDENGEVIYSEDFENIDDTIFSPFYLKTVNGKANADSGVILTPGIENPAPVFRKNINIDDKSRYKRALIYVAALGEYEISLNGRKVGNEYFAPGISCYDKEVYYRAYELNEYLVNGENEIRITLAHGHYDRAKGRWGDQLAISALIKLFDSKGQYDIYVTDEEWDVCEGPVLRDDYFWGEYYDANMEIPQDYVWTKKAHILNDIKQRDIKIKASERPPVRCLNKLKPVSTTQMEDGSYVYDFGQNFSGFCGVELRGEKGQVITFRYAEALNTENLECKDDVEGAIWTQNLYTADNTDYYVCKGEENEYFEPGLVCRGFRYVQISGLDYALTDEEISAIVLSSDNKRTGYFECSDAKLNRLYNSIFWTQLSNFVSLPSDCPQRDERLGWTGDAQTFARTATYNYDVYNFYREFLNALRIAQNEDGSYSDIAYFRDTTGGNNGWGDAGVGIVWDLYQQYGDTGIIYENYESMCKYADYLIASSDNYLRVHDGYGDHNATSTMDITMCNSAQTAHVIELLAKMSGVIGQDDNKQFYTDEFEKYKKVWQDTYINEDGSVGEWFQSEYVIPLAFGLYQKELDLSGAQKLEQSTKANDYHVTTGYIATKYLLPILCRYGYVDTAYKIIDCDTFPSWNYMFSHGATTITEGWTTFLDMEDGKYKINGSLNHYALGSVGEWIYSDVTGIRTDEYNPGYKHIFIEPRVGGNLTWAKGSYESVYGIIESSWEIKDGDVVYSVKIPANTTATLILNENSYHGYKEVELVSGYYEICGNN